MAVSVPPPNAHHGSWQVRRELSQSFSPYRARDISEFASNTVPLPMDRPSIDPGALFRAHRDRMDIPALCVRNNR